MRPTLALLVACLAASSALAADTNSLDQVKNAVTQLKAATNYSWTATLTLKDSPFNIGPLKGKVDKDGYAMVSQQFNDNTLEEAFKGEKFALKVEDQWKSSSELEGGQAMMAGWLSHNGAAADEAGKLLKSVSALHTQDGALAGDLTTDGAKELLTFGRGDAARGPKNAKGSVKFWLKDGVLAKYETHLQGTVPGGQDQDDRDVDMTRTVEIQEVGTTKLNLPAEARQKLEAN